MDKLYSLSKSKKILLHTYHLFRKKRKRLPASTTGQVRSTLLSLQQAIMENNREKAHTFAKDAESLSKIHLKKNSFEQVRDLIFALAFALVVAIIVRQVWFEPYEIPTGSMRPTFKEQDRLVVTKTTFGINLPLTVKHVYFDPSLVQRNGIFIFTTENMDVYDSDTTYFYLFPGKKQFIKRMLGKPGDTLYFYGGQMYGVDAQGNDISSQFQLPRLNKIEHIPFIHFEGKIAASPSSLPGIYSPIVIQQMNEPVAKLYLAANIQPRGEMINMPNVKDYGDLWGMKNYAMARLLNKDQVKQVAGADLPQLEDGMLYLELRHHPSLANVKLGRDDMGHLRPMLGMSTSYIPLQEKHLRALFNNLYTARFVVKNGFARRSGSDRPSDGKNLFLPHLPDVPDGTYEFYYGKAYQVKWQGITSELPSTHPLYHFDVDRIQLLYNIGIEFNLRFAPNSHGQSLFPNRYAYFRNKDLYLLGAPILTNGDPTLESFLTRERQKASTSNIQNPYHAFEDLGAPLTSDGKIDTALVKQYGLVIPPHSYLALGDNHAMSSDSRDFGFVPEGNVRGAPDYIFWPPGNRFGAPNQPPYPWINLPRAIIWGIALIVGVIWYSIHRKHNKLPLNL